MLPRCSCPYNPHPHVPATTLTPPYTHACMQASMGMRTVPVMDWEGEDDEEDPPQHTSGANTDLHMDMEGEWVLGF